MDIGLEGKVALVTGASRGIGAESAKALAAHGAAVIVNFCRNAEKGEEVAAAIRKAGGRAKAVKADVRRAGEVSAMADAAVKEFGKIDVLVNNANISFPIKPFTELSWEEIRAKIDGELGALYNCSRAVLKGMLERGSGRLVFVSSGLSRNPGYGFSAHAAAKSAVDSMAKVMALELGPRGISVNVVAPGLIRTDATAGLPASAFEGAAQAAPLRKVGLPENVAGTVVYLASDLSAHVTGEYVPVNGGSFML